MKKFLISFLIFTGIVFASPYQTDVSVFTELFSAYNSQFYPGVIQYAEQLEKDFPNSAFLGKSLLIKGECLARLGRFSEAEKNLEKAQKLCEKNVSLSNDCNFWLAVSYNGLGEYDIALQKYFEYCENAVSFGVLDGKKSESTKYYPVAILEAGRIYFKTGDFAKSIPLFEYIIQNGNEFSPQNYSDAILKLMDSYNRTSLNKNAISLYEKISKSDFEAMGMPEYIFYLFMEKAGEAYEISGEYKKAYDIYCEILASGQKQLAANALKKAYNVSTLHKNQVGAEPGTVLANAQQSLADSPELLGEFWTRLGADAYSAGDFKKALEYFDEAEKNAPIDLFLFAALFRAQIAAGKNPDKESSALAEKMIFQSRAILNEDNKHIWERESNILLARYAAFQENWEDVKKYAANINPLDVDTKYYLALASYNTGDYQKANELLHGQYNDIHGLSLAKSGDLKNAAFIYSGIAETRPLTDEERLNYAKILLYAGRYRESQIEAAKCGLIEANYILGLAQFNTWSWPYAETSFSTYLNSRSVKDEKSVSYAMFYLGYSQYRQGKTKDSYQNLSNFVKLYPNHELFWNAQIAAANSAVQNGDNEIAVIHALGAKRAAKNDDELEESVLLCADIYSDTKAYRDALAVLEPFATRDSELGMKCMYKIAQIYEKQQDFQKADEEYKNLSQKFALEKLADEAMYRRGELYYNAGLWDKAISGFSEYQKKYPVGSYVDASWYFTAQCYLNNGDAERAILQYRALIKRFHQSTYIYSSYKNLITLYREKGDSQSAKICAEFLLSKYEEQARNDGISEELGALEKLNSGKSEAIVKKESEYEKNGLSSTSAGRNSGTDLVFLYAADAQFERNAITLAEELLPLQKKNVSAESLSAAKNAAFLGKCYRKAGRNREAAQMYLSASEYFRMNAKDEEASSSLYGASDAFRAAGFTADAEETARTLKTLYPESRYAKSIK